MHLSCQNYFLVQPANSSWKQLRMRRLACQTRRENAAGCVSRFNAIATPGGCVLP